MKKYYLFLEMPYEKQFCLKRCSCEEEVACSQIECF